MYSKESRNLLKLHLTDYTLFVPRWVSLKKNYKGKDDTRLGVKDRAQKAFFLEMERKSKRENGKRASALLRAYACSRTVSPLVDIR